jgi:hypothetical protein
MDNKNFTDGKKSLHSVGKFIVSKKQLWVERHPLKNSRFFC